VPAVRQQNSHFPGATDRKTRSRHVLHHSARVIVQRVTASLAVTVATRLTYPTRGQPVCRTVTAHAACGQLYEQREPVGRLVERFRQHGQVIVRVELHVMHVLLDAVARVEHGGAAVCHL